VSTTPAVPRWPPAGCGDSCPYFPAKRYEDGKLDDPAGQDLDIVRSIRDRVNALLSEITAG
jgi:arsenate reductase (thioredoxin)